MNTTLLKITAALYGLIGVYALGFLVFGVLFHLDPGSESNGRGFFTLVINGVRLPGHAGMGLLPVAKLGAATILSFLAMYAFWRRKWWGRAVAVTLNAAWIFLYGRTLTWAGLERYHLPEERLFLTLFILAVLVTILCFQPSVKKAMSR